MVNNKIFIPLHYNLIRMNLSYWIIYILFIILAYLVGSISSSIILGKLIYGIDVRDYGSKNPGANNTQRVLGWKMGLLVLLFDLLKGVAAACLVFFMPFKPETNSFVITQIVFGFAAILGHIFNNSFGAIQYAFIGNLDLDRIAEGDMEYTMANLGSFIP